MQFTNANIFTRDFTFRWGSFCVEDGKFTRVLAEGEAAADAVDLQGAYVIPGLIDVHNHGNSNADFSDGSYEGLVKMARYLAKNGITSFAPASMTLPYETLAKAFATARTLVDEAPAGCAALRGIQMEGPFFSEKKKGAQNGAYLKDPDFAAFRKLQEGCGGLIKIVDVAAELPGAVEFAAQAKELSNVSIAHSDSDYEHALAVFEAGARHLTHLYNAMPPVWASFARLMFSTKRAFSCSESCPPFMAADATAPMAPIMPIWPFSSRSSALDIRRPNMLVSLSWTPKMWSRCCRAMWA